MFELLRVNPTNNREVGVLALAPTSGASASATVNSDKTADLGQFIVPAPTLVSATVATDSGETDPPSWLSTP